MALVLVLIVMTAPAGGDAQTAETGSVEGRIELVRGGVPLDDASGAVVHLPGVFRSRPDASPAATIRQRSKTFEPHVLAIPEGTSVAFPNLDRVHHNAFSVSPTCRFDLGLYKNGASRTLTFPKAGVCRIYCNIHASMSAVVFVTRGDAAVVTGRDGTWRLDAVPAGRHVVRVWHERGGQAEGGVDVVPGGVARRVFRLDVSAHRDAPHARKDGTPYGQDDEASY